MMTKSHLVLRLLALATTLAWSPPATAESKPAAVDPATTVAGGQPKAVSQDQSEKPKAGEAVPSAAAASVLCYRQVWFGPAVVSVGEEQMLVPTGSMAAKMLMSDGSEQTMYFGAAIRVAACKGGG
ncbi:MAG: hypothetical protein KAY22_02345 [Rhizorhabdus sp.]|uniref:hypothetical protein n=1 Tax=Rhizorhabdus sp. TaxID=1968843 RepID=UPI001B3F89D7|nr:hypothetical protein [Rhizorhabdus sp.]MBP8231121.1 hypothetical protein [Rhizorhabdus sp.]